MEYNNARLVEAAANSPGSLAVKSPRSPKVLEALARVDRKDFLSDEATPLFVVPNPNLLVGLEDAMDRVQKTRRERSGARQSSLIILGKTEGGLSDDQLRGYLDVMKIVPVLFGGIKEFYVPAHALAYNNCTLPIGYDQTCAAPSMIALMADLLELREGHKVLEVGTGCGYHAAITKELIGPNGDLTTMEIIPQLAKTARRNLERNPRWSDIEMICGGGSRGFPEKAPYDRIYLTASVNQETFDATPFMNQLNKDDGVFLFPGRGDVEGFGPIHVWVLKNGKLSQRKSGNMSFVPLQGENQ